MNELEEILNRIISKANLRNSTSEEHYNCSRCQDTGYYVEDNLAYECQCLEKIKVERIIKSSQITDAFREKRFSNFDLAGKHEKIKEMFQKANHYAANFEQIQQQTNNWLAFLGRPGAGKTHLIMAVANNLMTEGVPVFYFQHVEGFNELKELIDDNSHHEKIHKIKTVPVLIWDDLFKGRKTPTEWVLETTFEILNYRYLERLPVLISSEHIPTNLAKIDEAVAGRIVERAGKYLVVVTGEGTNHRLESCF